MMPFCHFLSVGADLELSSVLFSLVIEMPGDDDSAKILAQCFWDTERLHPDIQVDASLLLIIQRDYIRVYRQITW